MTETVSDEGINIQSFIIKTTRKSGGEDLC